jgi:hypothetical protein
MMRLLRCTFAVALLSMGSMTQAHVRDDQTNNKVFKLAFDPDRNFWGDPVPFLTVVYRGDDWGVPVYSLSIAEVSKRFVVRAVRSAGLGNDERPRQAGYRLYSKIDAANANSDAKLKALFDAGAVEWLEADLDSCPNAVEAVDAVRNAEWHTYADIGWSKKFDEEGDQAPIVMHADTITVRYRVYLQQVEYSGWLSGGDDHVTKAVLKLAEALQPCWKPATPKAPWHRKKPKD